MEAVPRLPMLSFELKQSAENVEFGPKLKQYIRDHYHEDPDTYITEIHDLEGLRASAIHASRDFTGCSTLKKYYCQLHYLLSRFPLGENSGIALTFNWYDIYSSMVYNVTDIKYEMACILYNIGALHTELGAMDARNTPDGMKISCTHFQCAAWAFQHLRDTYPQPRESDLSPTLLTFLYNVSLAQAQECILEKSMTDNRKPTIIAKVAMQVVEYLKTAMNNLGSSKSPDSTAVEIAGSRKIKMWRRYCEFKMAYYGAVALLYQGMQAEEQQKMGERVAYYQTAVDMLKEASKMAKNLDQQEDEMERLNKAAQSMCEEDAHELIGESLTFSHDVMGGKLTAAQKENEFVYHEKVPAASTLAEVKGASLVKGIPFSVTDPEVAGQDIFIKLVPLEAHQASSMYSEEKAKLLRRMGSSIHEKNEELESYLASMQLDSLTLETGSENLPQELIECCADLSASNGVKKLTDIMAKISSFYHDINASLKEIARLIEEEEEKEKEFLAMMGKRAPNMIIGELKREANKYREAHQSAQDNNTALHRAITSHLANLQLLSKPLDQVAAAIPSVASVEAQGDPATKQEVKRLLGKVKEMRTQRAQFEAQLRSDIQNDDITKQLVTNQDDTEEFFKNELKKHDRLVLALEKNMSAQVNILQALSEANAAYATTRRLTNQAQAQRSDTVSSLLASYNAYLNILKKAEDAQEFYHKLEGQVSKLASRVKSVCRVQDEEREEMLSANVKKFTGGVPPALAARSGSTDLPGSTVSGPKLKDFLQHMKGGPGMGAAVPPAGSTVPTQVHPGYGYHDQSAAYTSSMRPAPLGSEQSDSLTSCSQAGGYSANFSGQASAYRPSAPSPVPSPAPQSSGSPYKVPATAASYNSSGHYYSAQQMGTTAYSANATSVNYPSNAGATAAVSSSVTTAGESVTPYNTASGAYSQNVYNMSQAGSHPQYGYSAGYSYYGQQSTGTSSSINTASASGITQQSGAAGSPRHVDSTAQGQNLAQSHQYAYGSTQPSGATTGSSNAAIGGSGQPAAQKDNRNIGQSYYGYYQQPTNTPTVPTTLPTAVTSVTTTPSVNSQQAYPSSVTTGSSYYYPQYSYQYSNAQSTTTPAAMYSQAGTYYSSNVTADMKNQSGGVVYSNQPAYAGFDRPPYGGQPGGQLTGAQGSQTEGNYASGSYGSAGTYPASNAQSTGTTTTASQVTQTQWNMYASYPQSGITSISSSQAGTPGTVGTESAAYRTPSMSATYTTQTNATTVSAQTYQPPTPVTAVANNGQYNQMYNQNYQTWSQYGTQQSQQPQHSQQQQAYQPQYAMPQKPQQPQAQQQQPQVQQQQPQPQQFPYQPQQHSVPTPQAQAQPLQPQSHQPQNQQPQPQPQHASSTPNASVTSVTTGISNLDLLSGIELTSPPGSQWSPLTPQPAGSGTQKTADVVTTMSGATSVASAAPDVTAAAVDSSQPPAAISNNLPNVVSSNTATNNSNVVPTSILDLTALAKNRKPSTVDPLTDDQTLKRLAGETERLSKIVEGLDRKSLSGPTNLEKKWKELQDVVEKECGELKVSVARCYPLKNRFADILPFDHTRVTLPSARDDYINASFVQLKSTEESFPLILTQAPMPATFVDFWTMVWEQQVEIIVCLNSEAEVKNQIYWPAEVGTSCDYGQIALTLHSCRDAGSPVSFERVLHVTHRTSKVTRVIIHLQFLGWPPSAMPESPGPLLQFVSEVHVFQRQQRNKLRPVLVHCVPGLGRSTVFSILSAYMRELHAKGVLLDLTSLLVELSRQRRGGIQDKDHLYFLFSAALYYSQDVLMKRGILTNKATFEEGPREKTHVRHPSADLLSSYDLSRLKSKLGLDQESGKARSEGECTRSNSASSLLSNGSSAGIDQGVDEQKESSKESDTSVVLETLDASCVDGGGSDEADSDKGKTESALDSKLNMRAVKGGILDTDFSSLAPSLAASLDPQQFKIDPPVPGKANKITKESFENPAGVLKIPEDPGDPFSGLDPLWSHKKS